MPKHSRLIYLLLLFVLLLPGRFLAQENNLSCPESPPSRLSAGDTAYVRLPATEGEERRNLNVRDAPNGEQVGLLEPGQEFTIMGEGQCGENGLLWWPITTADEELSGWSVEGFAPDDYLMVPGAKDSTSADPKPTPFDADSQATPRDLCADAPPTRLSQWATAYAALPGPGESGFSLRVRNEPGGSEKALLQPGTLFRVLGQPTCDEDGYRWWSILTLDGQISGWSVEALSADNYLITPIDLSRREPLSTQNAHRIIEIGRLGLSIEEPEVPSWPISIAVSANASLLAMAEREITIWDAASGELLRRLPYPPDFDTNFSWYMQFSPDAETLAFLGDTQIWLMRTSDGEVLQSFPATGMTGWTHDGRYLIYRYEEVADVARDVNIIIFQDINAQADVAFLEAPLEVGSTAISPDGTLLAAAVNIPWAELDFHDDGTYGCEQPGKVYFWEINQLLAQEHTPLGMERDVWEIGDCRASGLAFRPDGEVLAVSLNTGTKYTAYVDTMQLVDGIEHEDVLDYRINLQLWDVASGQRLGELFGEYGAQFSPSGDLMVTFSQREGRAYRLWNAQLGGEITAFGRAPSHGHAAIPEQTLFSPDGSAIFEVWLVYGPYSTITVRGIPILD